MTLHSDLRIRGTTSHSRSQRARKLLTRLLRSRRGGDADSLRTTIAILKAQQEATLDGILVVDNDGKVLSYNRRFLEIWNIPPAVAASADDNELLGYAARAVANWDAFIDTVNYLYEHPHEVRSGDPVTLKDGRELLRSSVPVVVDGRITGRSWYFRDITERRKDERLQAALFRISQLTRESPSLDHFYAAVHEVIGELMGARNFYIAEYDAQRDIITFPYFVDQYDLAPQGRPPGRTLTAYVLRSGMPLLATPERFAELAAAGEVEEVGTASVDWLGVPLKSGEFTWGVIGVQTYDEGTRYTRRDEEILVFVSQHVAAAIEQKRKEDALRESEHRYRQMFENNSAIKLLIDPSDGRIVDANMAAAEFYGYSVETLRTMVIWDINTMGEERVRAELRNAAQQNRPFYLFRHRRANGEISDVEVHSGAVDVRGRKLLYSIIHDITERKRAEEALVRSEEKYRNIFNFASVGIYQSTFEGRLLTANQTLARMLGYDLVTDLLRMNLSTDIYYYPGQREELIKRFEARGYTTDYEVLWKKKNGEPIWVQLNAHSMTAHKGAPYFEGFVYDVTERKRAEQSLASANAQRKAVLDAATRVSIIATSADGTITVFNGGAERMLGYNAEEMIGRRSLIQLHVPEELEGHAAELSETLRRPVAPFESLVLRASVEGLEEREWTYVKANDERIVVAVSVTALRAEDGSVGGYLHVGTDITERQQAEETLRQQSAAITASMDGIGILNDRLEFTYVNDAMARLYAYHPPEMMIGLPLRDLFEPGEDTRLSSHLVYDVARDGRWRGEVTGRRCNATTFPQEISLTAIEGGGMVCVARDITERTYAEEQIKHLAYHDALTGLPNRLLFKDRLTVALSHAHRDRTRLAVLFLDLDRFKVINDSLGHNIGDHLLQAVAARVQACVRQSDTLARLGGDEFTLLLPSLTRIDDATPVAVKILEAVRHPFHIDGREFLISTSIGVSLYPEDGTDAETLIKNADTAMYQAKEQGRDTYQLFNAQINAKALQRIKIEHGLRKALPNHELAVFYQPIFDFRTGKISGMEALLRWNHPELGNVPPAEFIPLAEAIGVMVPIGMWAMRAACEQAKAWHDAGHKNLSLAVNLSVNQLQQSDLVERVEEILDATGLPARLLELEITESSAMQSPEASVRAIYDLKKLGVRISLDDFGTGHSSLSYLKNFPIDTLKVDQSFVRDIVADPDTAAIVTAIIAMAHSLRLKVIAEGVEFTEQATLLREHGCDQMQGYLIRRPVPAAEFEMLLTEG
jgi:diguanylate cyclase (GGDEF)-like protein/PAS domain S-box-containing protein